jgi:multicomponent K+:H+ antiporter subunit D
MSGAVREQLLTLPVLIPLVAAFAALALYKQPVAWRRAVSVTATLALLGVAVALVLIADEGTTTVSRLGDWPVPVAIVLVLDRLGALMVLLTAVVAVFSVWHAVHGTDTEGSHYHALFQLQLAGICGAFLTGDLFNLFVFFEILLIASYCLLVYGGTAARVRSGVHYVVLNLAGSSLFLVAIGALYGLTGTLNLAQLAERVALLGAGDAPLARSAALLLLVVFALKAALVPLYFWLPNAYAAAAAPIAAIFALMTKVGVYAIIRVSSLVFSPAAGGAADVFVPWLLPAALVTIAAGALGTMGSVDVRRMQGYLLVTSVGTMLAAVGAFTAGGLSASLYYMSHSTLATAAMFLVTGTIVGRPKGAYLVGALFFVGAAVLAGVPPFSGFLGKVLILQAARGEAGGTWVWALVLVSSAIAVVALSRAGMALFWEGGAAAGAANLASADDAVRPTHRQSLLPAAGLLGVVVLLTAFSGPASAFAARAADQLLLPANYVRAVLDTPGGR